MFVQFDVQEFGGDYFWFVGYQVVGQWVYEGWYVDVEQFDFEFVQVGEQLMCVGLQYVFEVVIVQQ